MTRRFSLRSKLLLGAAFLVLYIANAPVLISQERSDKHQQPPAPEEARTLHGEFTGHLIFPIYVSDVEKSAEFYRDVLGMEFLGYYDYEQNTYVATWKGPTPPIYAGFKAGTQKFGLHKPSTEAQQRFIGCGRYYFKVRSLEKHRDRIRAWGYDPSPVYESPLLKRFFVTDPDGLKIFFAVTQKGANLDPW